MKPDNSRRRDWSLIIFVLPLGIILMLFAGQIAIRIFPFWSVSGGMNSNLDPANPSAQQGEIQPISFDILTPMSWFDTFLTPHPDNDSGVFFPPLVIFEPTDSPTPTITATASPTVSPTATTATPTTTPRYTPTPKPTDDETPTPSPIPTGFPSTLVGTATAIPIEFNTGTPDGNVGNIQDGNYVIINLTGSPIIVNGPSDTSYDLVYYELYRPFQNDIAMDSVILSISSDGTTYYVVFNWGDGTPDNNSNVGDVAGAENDNQSIPVSELYGTPTLQTGILVDVDNAPSSPPPGNYIFLAIQAPIAPTNDGNDGVDVNSVEILP